MIGHRRCEWSEWHRLGWHRTGRREHSPRRRARRSKAHDWALSMRTVVTASGRRTPRLPATPAAFQAGCFQHPSPPRADPQQGAWCGAGPVARLLPGAAVTRGGEARQGRAAAAAARRLRCQSCATGMEHAGTNGRARAGPPGARGQLQPGARIADGGMGGGRAEARGRGGAAPQGFLSELAPAARNRGGCLCYHGAVWQGRARHARRGSGGGCFQRKGSEAGPCLCGISKGPCLCWTGTALGAVRCLHDGAAPARAYTSGSAPAPVEIA